MISPRAALDRLRDGNRRFVAGISHLDGLEHDARRDELMAGQRPFAVILGCSDSRVPVELVFDQGLGDLFVIRVAGNIVAPSQIGSVEFAVEQYGTRLVMVLGHSQCGAIEATLEQLEQPRAARSPHLLSIVDRIGPAIESLLEVGAGLPPDDLRLRATRANTRAAVHHLRHGSRILEERIAAGDVLVVGAHYSLATGEVDVFDGAPSGT
ncbi:MAG: carbonic anhydrase [Candidatus Krumholzibacteriia bacterium]